MIQQNLIIESVGGVIFVTTCGGTFPEWYEQMFTPEEDPTTDQKNESLLA